MGGGWRGDKKKPGDAVVVVVVSLVTARPRFA